MENLPNEIVDIIIGYLDKKALLSVRLLNTTWQSYAEEYLRNVGHFSIKTDRDVMDLLRMNTIPPFVRFSFRFSGVEVLSKGILEELSRKYGNVIESLRFERILAYYSVLTIDHSNMFELLMKTPNIKEIYVMNFFHPVDIKPEYQLHLPELRSFELEEMDPGFVKLILNSSPNIQQVKFGSSRITEDNWIDHITILQSIATRGIQLKLSIFVDPSAVNLQKLNEMVQIPFKVTELILSVQKDSFVTEEWSLVQESIEEFIQKHSTTLKLLKVMGWSEDLSTEDHWKLNLKNLDNLEELELCCLKLNLGETPMLNKIMIECDTELGVKSAPLLKHLYIQTDKTLPQLLDPSVQLESLSLHFAEETLTTTEADYRVELLNNFLLSHAKNLKVLEIEADNPTGLNKLNLPVMENLHKLELLHWGDPDPEIGKLKLQQSKLPHLEFLKLVLIPLYSNPTLNESFESVRTLIIISESLIDFKNTILQFPMLKKLRIERIVAGILPFVFKNIPHLEELEVQSDSGTGITWDELTGIPEVVNFVGEPCTRNLNTSLPNLGDLIDLKRLKIEGGWMDEVKAISYLISCEKLKNLKYFELKIRQYRYAERFFGGRVIADVPDLEIQKLILNLIPFVKIIESNNTRTNIPYKL